MYHPPPDVQCILTLLLTHNQSRGLTPDKHVGLYEAEIIQMVIDHIYYKDPEDDGVILRDAYTPFPLPALALIITAVCRRHLALFSRLQSS